MTAEWPGQFHPPAVDRKFWVVLGLSLSLHAVLLSFRPFPSEPPAAALPPIFASLRTIEFNVSEPLVAAAAPSAPTSVPQKARQTPIRAERPAAPRVTQTAGPAIVAAQTPPPSVAAAETIAAAPAFKPAAPTEAPRPAAPAVVQRPQSELLANYRQQLGELLAGRHEYPRVAAMRGWEGEVRLRLKVARKGNLLGVVLDRSSGFDVLDQHAVAMLEGMNTLPPLPEGLEGNDIQVVVPVNYRLKKST